MKPEGGLPHPN